MNGYTLSRQWFEFAFENPEKIRPVHSAIYFFAVEQWNRLGQKEKFGLPALHAMEAVGIKTKNTYYEAFADLVEWGFFIIIEKSKNQNSANIISLSAVSSAVSKIESADDTAPTSALTLATTQHLRQQQEHNRIIELENKGTNEVSTDAPTANAPDASAAHGLGGGHGQLAAPPPPPLASPTPAAPDAATPPVAPPPPKKKTGAFVPPTKEEVVSFFTENGYLAGKGAQAWAYYADADWHDSKGSPVKNWKQKMRGVWFKEDNRDTNSIANIDFATLTVDTALLYYGKTKGFKKKLKAANPVLYQEVHDADLRQYLRDFGFNL